ncbi:MAG: alpha/beta hydrolase [Rhodospirillaceae bacterium]|jgi:acetyl esterase|nr:alpha/beta hydrolase [Rhodospirillaceae bacterium]MBT5663998.1 alpha/beta hydrolase [Rhodospirillaceae bacterium]MBT5812445.1 alpha/beta hydrolase [Rhodospirillaceae bacterium]
MTDTAQIHPEMQAMIDARGPVPETQTLAESRDSWNAYSQALSEPYPDGMKVFDKTVHVDELRVPVRVYQPAGASDANSCVIYIHGGGFMKGDLDSSDTNAWGFAAETGATVVSVDYRLAPEHPFPAAFDDCYGVLTWIAAQGADIGVDSARIAVVGDSAGGSLTAALALAARDRGGPSIRGQAMIYPCTGLPPTSQSYIDNAVGPGLTTSAMASYYELYLPTSLDPDLTVYAMPDRASDFTNLPPAYVHVAALDPIRDDGRVYASKLALAGQRVTFREAHGMIHGFMRARLRGPAARAEFDAICAFLRSVLTDETTT